MKVTVKYYLNVRVGKPSVNAPCHGYLVPGTEIEVDGKLYDGDQFEGTYKWMKDNAGNYYWAGGINSPVTGEISKEALEAAVQQIKAMQHPGVTGIGSLAKMENGHLKRYIHMTVKDEATKNYFLNTFKIGDANLAFEIHVAAPPVKYSGNLPGAGISNRTRTNGNGTFGCVVTDGTTGRKALLSCQHVLKDDTNYNVMNGNNQIILSGDPQQSLFATHLRGMRSHEIDAGIAELTNQGITNAVLGTLKGLRDTTDDDVINNTRVTLQGYDSSTGMVATQSGVIINNGFSTSINYEDQQPPFQLNNLIMLSQSNNNNFNAVTKPGYSGSIVIDEQGYIVGMVVGGDNLFTYAIPINTIKAQLNFEILLS
ncbi:MAG: hypothetical protein JWO09_2569 [Bacteroidetes bacterium]|nr:hypothetical protein [Bacteroidota bacterium]